MYSDILRYAKTEDEKELLLKEVELLLAGIYKTSNGNFEDVLKKNVRAGVANAVREILSTGNIDLRKLFEDLQKQIKSLRPMTVTLAFEPSDEFLDEMYEYISKQTQGVYLDIKFDKSIIGGTVIEYGGRYYDFSLRDKLSKMNILTK